MSFLSRILAARRICCGVPVAVILFTISGICAAQSSEQTGFYLYERFDATSNTLGLITRIDSTAGYNFNRYFAIDAGLPLYIVRPSETALTTAAMQRATAIGNAHLAARFTFANPALTYLGTLTLTAPTGDEDKGLSTGKATYDLNNHFERSFGRITPFGAVGIANTISDTPFFIRPYTSQGLVTHFEGGMRVALAPRLSAGASLYTYEPSGEQTVVSRVAKKTDAAPPADPDVPGNPNAQQSPGQRRKAGVFEVSQTTVGPAEIARDRGGSLWLSLGPFHVFDVQIGYSRSTTHALDTVFFGVGVNLGSLIKKGRL